MAYQYTFESEAQVLERVSSFFPKDKLMNNFMPKWLLLQWHITNQCNLRCLHCYQSDYSKESELPLTGLFQILDQYLELLAKWNIKGHINITGGEPLISEHLFALLENINLFKSRCRFAILSNGTGVTNENAKYLKDLGCEFFQISVEGGKTIHDRIRGDGNFEKCIRAIEILKKHKIQTMVSFTASKLNVDSFDEVAKFCKRNSVDILWADRYIPLGNGKGIKDELLQPHKVKNFFVTMYKWHHKFRKNWFNKTELRMHRALHFLETEKHGCNCYLPYKCSAGRSLITVLPNGDVVPCRRMPVIVGNLMNSTLDEIYESSVLLKMLRKNDLPYDGCSKCQHWEICNGGLRCLAYAYYGNPFKSDPQCFKIYDTLPDY